MHQHVHFIWPFDQQHSSQEFTFSAVLHKLEPGEALYNKRRVLSHSVYVSWLQCWHSRVTLVTVMKAYICQRDCLTQTYNNFVFLKWIFFCIPWLRSLTWFPFRQLAHISVNNLRDNTHLYRSQGLYAHSFHFHFLEWLEKHGKLLSDVKTCWNSTLAGKYITAVLSFLIKVRLFISVNNCS